MTGLSVQDGSIAKALETIATGLLSLALESVTRPKLMVRPSRTTRASASTSEAMAGAHEMRGLVDGRHRTVATVGRQDRDHHRRVRERHQRLATDDTAVPAQPLGEGHAQDRAGFPIAGGAGRQEVVDAFDR